jgi:hypothetical protein
MEMFFFQLAFYKTSLHSLLTHIQLTTIRRGGLEAYLILQDLITPALVAYLVVGDAQEDGVLGEEFADGPGHRPSHGATTHVDRQHGEDDWDTHQSEAVAVELHWE